MRYWVLKLAGLLPNLQACGKCRTALETENWIAADGTPLCRACGGQYGEYLGTKERAVWGSILAISPSDLDPIEPDIWKALSLITQRLIRRAIEREPNSLRSFSAFELPDMAGQ